MKQRFAKRAGALDGIEAFLAVARHLSFRRAAAELGVSPSAAGQAVRALEVRLGVPLFLRTTRSVGLTQPGERLLSEAAPAYEALAAAAAAAQDLGARPSGLLRVAIARGAAPLLLRPVIAGFCAAYPEIELEVAADEQLLDIVRGAFDAGIRFGQLIAPDMTAIRLTPPFRVLAVASPGYLAATPAPGKVADLVGHRCLRYRRSDGSIAPWRLIEDGREAEIEVRGPLLANDYLTLRDAALDGLGIAQLPEPMAAPSVLRGELVGVLEAGAPSLPGMFLYHPGRRQVLPKLRAFIDYLNMHGAAVAAQ